jgi:omega-amidase
MNNELRISIVQSTIHWKNCEANLKMFDEKLALILPETTDIIVLPEMFTSGFTMDANDCFETMNGKVVSWMKAKSIEKQSAICGSIIICENEKYYNRLIWVEPNGLSYMYDKAHLFRLSDEHKTYTKGNEKLIINYKGWNICPMICYDLRFPVWCRQQFSNSETYRGEFDILLFVANWPERRNIAWKNLLQSRAIENQCYVIGANRVGEDGNKIYHSGDSSIINPLGEIVKQVADEDKIIQQNLLMDELIKIRRAYQFWQDADEFEITKTD